MTRIACLHTAESNIEVFDEAHRQLGLGAGVQLRHVVRADLLAEAEKAHGLTHDIADHTREALTALAKDADAVLLTCSTLGPAADSMHVRRVLRVDAALADEAARAGGKIIALVATETTITATRRLFEHAGEKTGATVEVRLVPGAWEAFRAGDQGRYFALVAEAADGARSEEGDNTVVLAQASMAAAARLTKREPAPLTSPTSGLMAALMLAQAASRTA